MLDTPLGRIGILSPPGEKPMDEDFIKGRAQDIRELAAKADPFTRKRLIDLADTYERRLRLTPHAATRLAGAHSQPQVKR